MKQGHLAMGLDISMTKKSTSWNKEQRESSVIQYQLPKNLCLSLLKDREIFIDFFFILFLWPLMKGKLCIVAPINPSMCSILRGFSIHIILHMTLLLASPVSMLQQGEWLFSKFSLLPFPDSRVNFLELLVQSLLPSYLFLTNVVFISLMCMPAWFSLAFAIVSQLGLLLW